MRPSDWMTVELVALLKKTTTKKKNCGMLSCTRQSWAALLAEREAGMERVGLLCPSVLCYRNSRKDAGF